MFAQVMHHEGMINYESAMAPYRQVAAILRERIDAGRYTPGTRLPSINDLVQEFGVARTTAGKALRLLVADDLAEISQGMGFYVRDSSENR
jgi:DNA-binding GntR family transcriptional regulator